MKVLLINPSQDRLYRKKMMPSFHPLGLLYIGTVLKKEGHQVRLVDIDAEKVDEQAFNFIFNDFKPEAVGITCTTPTFSDALKWARLSKSLKKDLSVILGGIHPTTVPEQVIAEEQVDIVVAGEGEETARELFNRLSVGRTNLDGIKGIYFKEGNRVVNNGARPLIEDLDSIPFPDRSLLERPGAYMPPDSVRLPAATLITSRGCPGSCTFCCVQVIFSRRFRARSVANIIDEIELMVNQEQIKEIYIVDDVFTMNKQRTLELCREIKQKNMDVSFQLINGLRVDSVDRDILTALKEINVKTVAYGVETGSEEVLKNVKKNISLDTIREAFRLSKELGFSTWAFIIFGLPGDTDETIKETIKFTKELDPDFAKFFILKPYPGSQIYTQLERDNLLLSRDYDDYGLYANPVHKLPGLEPERMLYWQKRAFREFYLRPKKIFAHLLRIKSWTHFKLIANDIIFGFNLILQNKRKNK